MKEIHVHPKHKKYKKTKKKETRIYTQTIIIIINRDKKMVYLQELGIIMIITIYYYYCYTFKTKEII